MKAANSDIILSRCSCPCDKVLCLSREKKIHMFCVQSAVRWKVDWRRRNWRSYLLPRNDDDDLLSLQRFSNISATWALSSLFRCHNWRSYLLPRSDDDDPLSLQRFSNISATWASSSLFCCHNWRSYLLKLHFCLLWICCATCCATCPQRIESRRQVQTKVRNLDLLTCQVVVQLVVRLVVQQVHVVELHL